MNTEKVGNMGEEVAINFLMGKGYKILDKNYSFRIPGSPQKGEIDIVAQKNNSISFIEVKSQARNQPRNHQPGRVSLFSPEQKVNFQKQRKIIRAAQAWLLEKRVPPETRWQIDIISINLDLGLKRAKVYHFKNAFGS